MHFTQLTLTVPAQHIDTAADIAHMVVSHGIYVEDYRDMEADVQAITGMQMIDETLLQQDRSQGFVHVYLPAQVNPAEAAAWLSERCTAAGIPHEIATQDCRNEDWENNWKAYFHPLPIGEKLLIQPTWQAQVNPEGRAVLLLDPGVAFGSGSHATTRLCLQALEQHITPACTVLDVGCGSGILAIASALLGASGAIGVDIDPAAVQNAQENAARNGLAPPQVQFLQGDLAQHITGRFDVIVSNIVADAIIALAPQVSDLLAPGGVWLSSGIIDTRTGDVQVALAAAGFAVAAQHEEEGWVCLAAQPEQHTRRI
ncbi:MAG: 50S ribosomal protein L11 methyltransferase [Oscillospiraceae bacterium]|nr:50S ribosomal protein L11 methyltransferase [Oscillospiraceae bacterium]